MVANVAVRSFNLVLCVINGRSFNEGAILLSSRHTFMYCLARQKVLKRMPSAEFIAYVPQCLSKSDSAPADVVIASSCFLHTVLALASGSDPFVHKFCATYDHQGVCLPVNISKQHEWILMTFPENVDNGMRNK